MSKVIKATHLVMSLPRTIKYLNNIQKTELNQGNDEDKSKDLDPDEAKAILAETEVMVSRLLNEARVKAEAIINDAREQASKIVEEGRTELEHLKQESKRVGYEEGFAAGQQALAKEREELLSEVAASRAALDEERRNLIKEMEPKLLQLAIYMARQIIHAELRLAPDQIRNIVRATLDKALETGDVILKVHSSDYDEIVDMLEETKQRKVQVEVDNSIQRGCVAETRYGIVDGTVDGQLKEVAHELLEVLPE